MPQRYMFDVHLQKFKLAMAWNKFDLAVLDLFNENNKTFWTVRMKIKKNTFAFDFD